MARAAASSKGKKAPPPDPPLKPSDDPKPAKPTKQSDCLASLSTSILSLFNKSQHSLTAHRKLVNNLHGLFLSSSKIREEIDEGDAMDKTIKLAGEKAFTEACYSVLDNLIITKKGVTEADRVIRFLGAFCAFAAEHDPDKGSSDQTPTNRLLLHLIKYLSRGFEAKNKIVRFRCCQILAYVVNSLEEIDDALFSELKHKLLIRVHDKEKDVRQQAAIASMNFRPVDEDEEVDDEEENVNDALIDLMIRDPSSEVRRTVLHKLCEAPTATTLPAILTRLRDIDPLIRRTVYRDLYLATTAKPEPTLPHDPSQCFTLDQRHLIIKGVKDREEGVRKETINLVNCWIKVGYAGNVEKLLAVMDLIGLVSGEEEDEDDKNKIENIEHVIKAWVAVGGLNTSLDPEDGEQDARTDEFCSEAWWSNINPERAFLLRVVADHYKSHQDEVKLDEVMPVVTALAFRIEHNFKALLDLLKDIAEASANGIEDEETRQKVQLAAQKTFVIRELLALAMIADYGDESGRRKMFSLLRDLVSDQFLPHSLIPGCLEVLLKLSTGERDFMRVIVELVQELRGNLETDANFATTSRGGQSGADDEQQDDADEDADEGEGEASFRKGKDGKLQVTHFTLNPANADLDLRCLAIVKALLERVSGSIKDNTSMFGIVHELIVPAVRSYDGPIRERGLLCLGLCSLLAKDIALDSFGVFVHQVQAAEIDLRIKVLKIVFDLLLQHGIGFLAEKGHGPERVIEFLLYSLDQDSKEVQATAAIGISKLMLSGIITNSDVLQMLVLVYFSPETCDNQKLRQCLSYFLPVYCYCSSVNQRRMQSMMLPALDVLSGVYDDQEDKGEMLSPGQIASQLVDWTDPSKVVVLPGCKVDWEMHLDAAIEIVKNLYRVTEKDERKMYCQMLPKLVIPDHLESEMKIRGLSILISDLHDRRPLSDLISRNTMSKFQSGLQKKFPDQLNGFTEEEAKKIEGLEEYFTFMDEYGKAGEDDDEEGSSEADEINSDPDAASDDYSAKVVIKKTPVKKSIKSVSRLSIASLRQELSEDEDDEPAPRRSARPRVSRLPDPKEVAVKEKLASLIGSSTDENASSDAGEPSEKEDQDDD